eukprot:248193-Amphidinium_carterae.1
MPTSPSYTRPLYNPDITYHSSNSSRQGEGSLHRSCKCGRFARHTLKSISGPHYYFAGDAAGGAAPSESDPGSSHPRQRDVMPIDTHNVCHGGVHEVLGAWHSSEPSLCGTWSALHAAAAPDTIDCVVVEGRKFKLCN